MPRVAAILTLSMLALAGCEDARAPAANETQAATPAGQTNASGPGEKGAAITVSDAWVQLPVVPGRPGAAYFTVTGNRTVIIDHITGPAARIELHETNQEGSVTRMRKFDVRAVGQGETIRFEPGGDHAMLFDLKPGIRAGQIVPLTFTLQGAPDVTVEAQVRSVGQ